MLNFKAKVTCPCFSVSARPYGRVQHISGSGEAGTRLYLRLLSGLLHLKATNQIGRFKLSLLEKGPNPRVRSCHNSNLR